MTALTQDLRYGWRMLSKSWGFTAVASLALALGIGANTAIFSVVRAVLLRALPYQEPDRIVLVWTDNPAIQVGFNDLPPNNADVVEWRSQNHVFERLAAFGSRSFNLSGWGEPEKVGGSLVTSELIPLLGVEPMLGRSLLRMPSPLASIHAP